MPNGMSSLAPSSIRHGRDRKMTDTIILWDVFKERVEYKGVYEAKLAVTLQDKRLHYSTSTTVEFSDFSGTFTATPISAEMCNALAFIPIGAKLLICVEGETGFEGGVDYVRVLSFEIATEAA